MKCGETTLAALLKIKNRIAFFLKARLPFSAIFFSFYNKNRAAQMVAETAIPAKKGKNDQSMALFFFRGARKEVVSARMIRVASSSISFAQGGVSVFFRSTK